MTRNNYKIDKSLMLRICHNCDNSNMTVDLIVISSFIKRWKLKNKKGGPHAPNFTTLSIGSVVLLLIFVLKQTGEGLKASGRVCCAERKGDEILKRENSTHPVWNVCDFQFALIIFPKLRKAFFKVLTNEEIISAFKDDEKRMLLFENPRNPNIKLK